MLREESTRGLISLRIRGVVGLPGELCPIVKEKNMKNSKKDKVEGAAHELKGKVKEKIGKAVGNPDLEVEGADEKVGGKIQKKIGGIEKVFEE
jgi:uncharacterized protein YjbJ (UPF0337 family)